MKLHLLNRSSIADRSLTISHNLFKHFLRIWHFHEEFELVLILQSSGMRFVGNSIEEFDIGDLVLIGKNVPHMWLNDDKYFHKESTLKAEAIAVHFKREFLGTDFFKVPEMQQIRKLLELASQGIKFINISDKLIEEIKDLVNLDITSRIIGLIAILNTLSKHKSFSTLSSSGLVNTFHESGNKRLDKMYEFIFENFNKPISSSDVAEIVLMNKSAFSRFFKKIHRKPFTKYLNELRIGYACKLLLAGNESVTSIGYLCGFNNISNFNRQFKIIKGESPTSYLQSIVGKLAIEQKKY